MKKKIVLVILFVFPLVAYMFFASGVNNFGKLPILTENVTELDVIDTDIRLQDKITILGFLGRDVANKKGNAFNLNQKIYKRFHEFADFQVVMLVLEEEKEAVTELKQELSNLAPIDNWQFVYTTKEGLQTVFNGLRTNLTLDGTYGVPEIFIIDKDRNLRGRDNDEDQKTGVKYGFDATSVADLNNKMEDDVKIILAEYRLALKKNNADRN
ncbi:Hypothetical protein I595_2630 [Croceitalea dokdonensis DOKDO 023]|uniref:Membrane or secreted protein n=1 Tax=Croceitalea dokdonensis DOKDO 023 TaxID=1300341 RepID=A0A0P7B0E4_9FLAO|nr:hypothetical protein [Croceitalea dokdonensis]KPM31363.1 Hypothetical protein I595_2630 [Croceitalea dokdonensis DOKDO 023]